MKNVIKSFSLMAAFSFSNHVFSAPVAKEKTIAITPVSDAVADTDKTSVAESDDAIAAQVKALHKELDGLRKELNKNAGARTESMKKRLTAEISDLEARLVELDKEVRDLVSTKGSDVKVQLKETLGGAITSAGEFLKKLGKEIRN